MKIAIQVHVGLKLFGSEIIGIWAYTTKVITLNIYVFITTTGPIAVLLYY